MRINVGAHFNKTYYTIMVMKLTPSLEETTVQGIDMKCFLIGLSVICFCHFTF